MRKLFFISTFVLVAFAAHSQTPTFTFECFCGTLTPADTTCDICNTTTQSRYFKGLLIRKNGTAFKWIEEPYTVIQNFNALTFRELIPNAEQIRIELSGTEWTTIEGFRDSVQCPCAGGGSVTLVPGPGISIYGDTIAAIPQQIDTFDIVGGDTLRISLERDSVPFHFVILPPDSDNQNLSYAPSTGVMSISGGTGDTINVMVGASAGTDGERGLVPKPLAGEEGAFLRGDGTWANPSVGGDNWGSQVAQVTARLSGDGTAGQPLDIAQQGAISGQVLKWNGTSWAPANDLDTSGYNYTFQIVGDSLCVTDGAGTLCVDVSQFLDNTDTSGYNLDFRISNDTLYIRDGDGELFVVMPDADGSETIVTGANGVVVTGDGTSGTPYVVAPPAGTDTQTLRYSGTTLTANSALTNNGAQIGINSAPDGSYRLKVKQSTDTDGIAVERSSSTSKLLLYHNANGVLQTNANNMHFLSAGNIEMYGAGGGFITQVSVKTQTPIAVASGNAGVFRIDPTYAPTSAGGDLAFAKIYPNINQTGAADQPMFGVDFNPNIISIQGQLYAFRSLASIGRFMYQPNGDTVSSHLRGRLGIGSGTTDPVRRLHVVGDMRLTGSVDTPTAVMGRDGDGDIANLSLSGLSISSGTLTATDPSPTNEIQNLDTFEIVGNTLRASLLNDAVPFSSVDLSAYLDNTDDQKVDTFRVNAGNVELSLESDGEPAKTIPVTSIAPVQAIAAGAGISVSGTSTVTVTNTGDLSNTNEIQNLDTFEIVSNTLRASLLNDGVPFSSVDLSPYLDNTDDQKVDTFEIISHVLRLSLESDAEPFKSVDLSPYVNVGTDLSYTGTSSPVTLNSSTGNDVTHTAGTGIGLSATSGNMTITNTAPDQTVTITNGGGIAVSGSYPAFTLTAADQSDANEGILGVGAGGANTSTLTSNTTGQTPVTVSGSTGIGVSESTASNGGTITVAPANDLAALEALGSTGIAVRTGSETWTLRTITAGAGISVADGDGVSGNPTITNTGDLSATNEAWTIDADDADTELISNQTVKFQGAGTITTDYNPATDVLLITGAASSDGNGIYGDGTAGSGNDVLPPGGSTVTIPGQWQPLNFAIDNSATQTHTALKVTTDYCSDDSFTKYFVGKSPSDSLEIYNFDCSAVIKETGGTLTLETNEEMYLVADSVNATAPTRTIAPYLIGQSTDGFFRKIAGASSGQILQWNGTNWALASAPAAGITGAENGLTVSGSNVRLGGTLITSTIINQSGFDLRTYGGKYGHSQYTGFSYSPTQTFGVSGYEGNPTTGSSPTADGIAEYVANTSGGVDQPNSLTIGAFTTDNNGMWMQARSRVVPNFYYPLLLQPNGGRLAVGRSGTTASHFTVTASGLTGSTASGMVGLFENSGGSGNVSVGFGAGSDAVSGQLMWNGTADAMRITNRNSTNGTSSVRVAVGGETADVATFEKSAATSLVQFGVGTTTPHSTVQSAGSMAMAYLETLGAPTFDETKHTVVYTNTTNVTWTLPTAAACACEGRVYILHHATSSGTITLSQNISKGSGGTFNTLTAGQWAYIVYGSSSIRGYKLASL